MKASPLPRRRNGEPSSSRKLISTSGCSGPASVIFVPKFRGTGRSGDQSSRIYTNGASLQPDKTCLIRKPGNQEKSDHGFLVSEFPSSGFFRVSWFPA